MTPTNPGLTLTADVFQDCDNEPLAYHLSVPSSVKGLKVLDTVEVSDMAYGKHVFFWHEKISAVHLNQKLAHTKV